MAQHIGSNGRQPTGIGVCFQLVPEASRVHRLTTPTREHQPVILPEAFFDTLRSTTDDRPLMEPKEGDKGTREGERSSFIALRRVFCSLSSNVRHLLDDRNRSPIPINV